MKKCKKPCHECAFRKTSPRGYFGGNSLELYYQLSQAETVIPCHMRSSTNEAGDFVDVSPCIGQALTQIKSCKAPYDPELKALHLELREQENFEELKDNALADWEFHSHHGETSC